MGEEEQALCLKACELFVEGKYEDADKCLMDLSEMRKSDWRTQLNRSIVAFCASKLTELDEFQTELNKISEQVIETTSC